ncbi:BnaCnng32590D [Brassica napus]|uniref:BnaCnng32590D protein n=1 Tax=Brassica napus TaxID=3708 RepID=A0A078IZM9_BRANA|nr:BnaCnng32590D [Brassica napus]
MAATLLVGFCSLFVYLTCWCQEELRRMCEMSAASGYRVQDVKGKTS